MKRAFSLRSWVTIPEAADLLHLSRTSVYRLVVELRELDPLEVLSIGQALYLIDRQAVERLLKARTKATEREVAVLRDQNIQRLRDMYFALGEELEF